MASLLMNGDLKIWDVPAQEETWSFSNLSGLNNAYSPIAFSPDDMTLVVAGGSVLHFISLVSGESKDLNIPYTNPSSVAFSDDGKLLAVGSFSGRIDIVHIRDFTSNILYDPPESESKPVTLNEVHNLAWALLFVDSARKLIAGNVDGDIRTFAIPDRDTEPQTPTSKSTVDGMVRGLAMSDDQIIAIGTDNTLNIVRIWNARTGAKIVEQPGCNTQLNLANFAISAHGNVAIAVCFSVSGRRSTYHSWALPSGNAVAAPPELAFPTVSSPTAVSDDGSVFVVADTQGNLHALDTKSRSGVRQMTEAQVEPIASVQYLQSSHELALSTRTQTALWKTDQSGEVQTLESLAGPFALSPDGNWMAYFDNDYHLKLVDRKGNKTLSTPITVPLGIENGRYFINRLAISQVGPTVFWIEGAGYGGYAKYWKSGDLADHIVCASDSGGEVAVSGRGRFAAVACNRGQIGSQSSQVTLYETATMKIAGDSYGDLLGQDQLFPKPTSVGSLTFLKNEKVYAANNHGNIRLTNTNAEDPGFVDIEPKTPEHPYIGAIALSEDGSLIAAQSTTLDLITGQLSFSISLMTSKGSVIRQVGLPTVCNGLSFIRNTLVVALQDGTARLYSLPDLVPRLELAHPDGWVAVAPNGLFDGSAEALRWIGWRRHGQRSITPLDTLYDSYYHPGLLGEVLDGRFTQPTSTLADDVGFGSLRFMARQGYAHLEYEADITYLCFTEKPQQLNLYSDGAPLTFASNNINAGVSATCPWRATIHEAYAKLESAPRAGKAPQHCVLPKSHIRGIAYKSSTLYVQTIAVETYDPTSRYPSLPSAIPSAEAIEKLFLSQGAGPGHLFTKIVVLPGLRDGGIVPTLRNIRDAGLRLATQVKPDDTVLIYLTGHGIVPPGTEMFYFAPRDFDPTSLSSIRVTGFSAAMLSDLLRGISSNHVAVVLDACQSGAALTSLAKIAEIRSNVTATNASRQKNGGIYLLASATALQVATAPASAKAGPIAQIFASAGTVTNNRHASRVVLLGELLETICETIPTELKQTPLIFSSGSDFPILERPR